MKKDKTLLNTTIIVALLIITGKILGFVREAIIAGLYGATAETDAFFLAEGMPGMIFPAVCSSISTAFTSIYIKKMTESGKLDGDKYASRILTFSVYIGVVLGIIGATTAQFLVPIFAPGFSYEQSVLAIRLTRLTMGGFVLIMLQYMFRAIQNANKSYIMPQMAGGVYNVVIIIITLALGRGKSMDVLTLTVIFGLLIQVLTLMYGCKKRFSYTRKQKFITKEIKEILLLTSPILLGNSVVQLNTIVDKALGSTLEEGSMSALNYANSLSSIVTSVFVLSLSTVLFPTLTESAANKNVTEYRKTLMQSFRGLTMVLMPISVITFVECKDIVTIVYARGNFDQEAIKATSEVLRFYSLGFAFIGIREVFSRALFALQDTRTPMINSTIGVVCNIICSIALVRRFGITGIAIGTFISSLVSAMLLLWSVWRRVELLSIKEMLISFGKQLVAGAVSCGALILLARKLEEGYPLIRFAVLTLIGCLVYFSCIILIDWKNMKEIGRRMFTGHSD